MECYVRVYVCVCVLCVHAWILLTYTKSSFYGVITRWIIWLFWICYPCWNRIYTRLNTILHCRPVNVLHYKVVHNPCVVQPVNDCIVIMNQHMLTMLLVENWVLCQKLDSMLILAILIKWPTNSQATMAMTTKLDEC